MPYSDKKGGGSYSKPIIEYSEDERIAVHRARVHPAFAVQFIRSYKAMLFKQVEAD